MVVETFRDIVAVKRRFEEKGRMIPEGATFVASWLDPATNRCFQVMEAIDADTLNLWTDNWDDIVDFEVIPVESSAEFWARI